MKYYSETLKRLFDTPEELAEHETAYARDKAKDDLSKKVLSQKIEDAEKAVDKAYKEYEDAKNRAAEILEASNQQVADILNDAKAKIREAEKERTNAIVAFNQKYGAYRVNYTGERAKTESERINRMINDVFSAFGAL